jgi:hypothetical protein
MTKTVGRFVYVKMSESIFRPNGDVNSIRLKKSAVGSTTAKPDRSKVTITNTDRPER